MIRRPLHRGCHDQVSSTQGGHDQASSTQGCHDPASSTQGFIMIRCPLDSGLS